MADLLFQLDIYFHLHQ